MKRTRRFFAIALIGWAACAASGFAQEPKESQGSAMPYRAYVGTYTTKTESKGIYALTFDPKDGKIAVTGVAAETPDPSFVAVHPSGKFVYAVNEGGKNSMVTAFAVDAASGKLTQLNQISSLGEDPCFLSFDKTGKYVLVANYTSGNVAVFAIEADGKLGEKTAFVQHKGSGPNKERQEGPHAHFIQVSEDNRFAFVVDLGLDEVAVYKFDAKTGSLTPNDPAFLKLKPGTGPRHLAFSPDERFAFVITEMGNTVVALSYDLQTGAFQEIDSVSTLPKGFSGRNDDAEIAVHPNGKYLYASNRGADTIAIFSIDPTTGKLTLLGQVPTGGKEPRHFLIDPTGAYLLAENQYSNTITVFHIDASTGGLTATGESASVPSPVCVAFAPR